MQSEENHLFDNHSTVSFGGNFLVILCILSIGKGRPWRDMLVRSELFAAMCVHRHRPRPCGARLPRDAETHAAPFNPPPPE